MSRMSVYMNAPTSKMRVEWFQGRMHGGSVRYSVKTLQQMRSVFLDRAAADHDNADRILYSVQWCESASTCRPGALNWGVTTVEPGKVGSEFNMTHGHFHLNEACDEYYTVSQGEGMLVLMDRDRETSVAQMAPGTLHCIDGRYAHRVVNTGTAPLIFWACWPSDAGHDYETISKDGFGIRVFEDHGKPVILTESEWSHES